MKITTAMTSNSRTKQSSVRTTSFFRLAFTLFAMLCIVNNSFSQTTLYRTNGQKDKVKIIMIDKNTEQVVYHNAAGDTTASNYLPFEVIAAVIDSKGNVLFGKASDTTRYTQKTTDTTKNRMHDGWMPKSAGFGILLNDFLDQKNNYATLLFPFSSKEFRFEMEVGLAYKNNSANFLLSPNFYGTWQTGKFNFYAGGGLGLNDSSGSVRFSIYPAIGGEYIIARRFSLGADARLVFSFDNYTEINTVSRLIFRYYLSKK